jgi:uncharacterized protein involved in exopolysaccharide biosynthesis
MTQEDQSRLNQFQDSMADDDEISLLDLLLVISENIKLLILGPIFAGIVALGFSTFQMTPVFTAKTTLIPPAAQGAGGGSAAAILGQLGGLGGLVGGALSTQGKHMAYLDSDLLRDEIIQKYDLQKRWEHKYITQTRTALKGAVVIKDDKKSGLITLEFTDKDPKFAAEVLNAYVAGLSRLLGEAAIEDARRHREFLEKQISEAMRKSYQSPQVRDAVIQGLVREFETTRLAEQQPNPNIVQVDIAKAPELKSGPKRALISVITSLATGFALLLFVFIRQAMRNASQDPESAGKLNRIRRAFGLRPKAAG